MNLILTVTGCGYHPLPLFFPGKGDGFVKGSGNQPRPPFMRRLTSGNGRNYHSGFTLTMVHSVILTRTSRSLPTGSGFGSVGSTGSGISGPTVPLAVTFSLAEY